MKEDEKIRDKNRRAPQSGGGSREDVPHRTSIKAAREAQHSHRPKTTQPEGEAKKASRPAGERVNRPAGERASRPTGERDSSPNGRTSKSPGGRTGSSPSRRTSKSPDRRAGNSTSCKNGGSDGRRKNYETGGGAEKRGKKTDEDSSGTGDKGAKCSAKSGFSREKTRKEIRKEVGEKIG